VYARVRGRRIATGIRQTPKAQRGSLEYDDAFRSEKTWFDPRSGCALLDMASMVGANRGGELRLNLSKSHLTKSYLGLRYEW